MRSDRVVSLQRQRDREARTGRRSRMAVMASIACGLAAVWYAGALTAQTGEPSGVATVDPFARYTTPGQCQQAAARLHNFYWRDKRPDTVVYAPLTDSVPVSVLRAVRACAARFSVATVPTSELRNLAQLYLWTGQDSLARVAIDRSMRDMANRSASERGWVLSLWVRALLSARPTRTALLTHYLAQLDALGAPAATWRMFVHADYADYALSLNDRVLAEAEGRAAIAAGRQMRGDDRIDWVYNLRNTYTVTAAPIALVRGKAPALALLDTMTKELTPLRPAGSSDQRQLLENFAETRIPYSYLGRDSMPRVQASAWYGAPGDTIYPKRGAVSILLFFYGPSYSMFATVRRLHERYGAQGVNIVFMTTTRGYFRELPMPVPAVESDSLGHYVRGFLNLPVSLAAETTRFSHIADGRRRNEETANAKAYSRLGGAVLFDRRGVVRWIGEFSPRTEAVWDALIRGML